MQKLLLIKIVFIKNRLNEGKKAELKSSTPQECSRKKEIFPAKKILNSALSDDEEIELPGAKVASGNAVLDEENAAGGVGSSMARDMRRLKSATLERMGKILKIGKSNAEKVCSLFN